MIHLPRDRRALFFLLCSVVSALLIIPCPIRFHYVGISLSIVYLVLALLSWADTSSRIRAGRRR
jgi:hypothetical protein